MHDGREGLREASSDAKVCFGVSPTGSNDSGRNADGL